MKNKELTKQRIINAVGEIFKTEGQKGLKIARIAAKAGVDRALIYQYFGKDIKALIEKYIVQKDYWLRFFEKISTEAGKNNHETSKDLVIDILQNQWRYFSEDIEMQHLILWELSGNSELMKSIHNTRELLSEPILEMAETNFVNTDVNFKAIAVLLLGGIYYANLHTMYNGNIMCGLDIKSPSGQNEIIRTISQLMGWAYENAEKK